MEFNNNHVSPEMSVSRIVAKGQVESLANGFHLKGYKPFSVYIRPKTLTTLERDVLLNCKLYKEALHSPVPVPLFTWVELCIISIAPDAELLKGYDIYWGAGTGAQAEKTEL